MSACFVFGVVEDLIPGDCPRIWVRVSDRWVERVWLPSESGVSVGDRVRFRLRARAVQGPRGPVVSLSAFSFSVCTADGWVDAYGGLDSDVVV